MPRTSSRKAQQRRRLQKRRDEARCRLRPPGQGAAGSGSEGRQALAGIIFTPPPIPADLAPGFPGGPASGGPSPSADPLAPLIPTSADSDTRLG